MNAHGMISRLRKQGVAHLAVLVFFAAAFAGLDVNAANYQAMTNEEVTSLLSEMETRLKGVRTMRADFVQERRMSLFEDTLTITGLCCFQAPDNLRWDLSASSGTVLIHNGNRTARFRREGGHLAKLTDGSEALHREVARQIVGWIQGDFAQSLEQYEVQAFKGGQYKINFLPRSKATAKAIEAIELRVNGENLRVQEVIIHESQGDSVHLTFRNIQENVALSPGLFDLERPEESPM